MRTVATALLLLMLAAIGWITGCNRMSSAAKENLAPPNVSPEIYREALTHLLRQNNRKPPPAPETGMWAHKVRNQRETFYSIALWYTGSGMNWPRLVEANPDIDPKRIQIGDTILIPESLITNRRPLPAGHPNREHRHREVQEKSKPQLKDSPAGNDEIPLFGPIGNKLEPATPEKNEFPALLESLDP
jgi:hypothetical protein